MLPTDNVDRKLMGLPARLWGLGITDPSSASEYDFNASLRVTAPLCKHGFCLHKGAFADALALRYGWAPTKTYQICVRGFF